MRPSAFRRLRQFTTLTVLVTFVSQTVFGYMPAQTVWDQRRDAGRHKTYEVAGLPLSSMPLMRSSLPFSAVRPSLLPSSNPSLVRLKRLLTALAPNGVVRDVSEGSSKTIVFIEDVHDQKAVQDNIASLILNVLQIEPAAAIALEGAAGPIDLAPFRGPDAGINREAAYLFLDGGLIAGPEAALLSAPKAPETFGLEDARLYHSNVTAVQAALPLQKDWKGKIAAWDAALRRDTASAYGPELQALDEATRAWRSNALPMTAYVETLARRQAPGAAYPQVQAFLRASAIEKQINFGRAERERSEFISALVNRAPGSTLHQLVENTLAASRGEMPYAAYHAYLRGLARDNHLDLGRYPDFGRYVEYVSLCDGIRADALLSEIESYRDSVWSSLIKTPQQELLRAQTEDLDSLRRLTRLEMTPVEWGRYSRRRGAMERLVRERGASPDQLKPFEDFYAAASARNTAMAERVAQRVSASPAQLIVMVAGGFHAAGLRPLLAKAGFTVVWVTPKLVSTQAEQGDPYLAVFSRGRMPLDRIFKSQKISLVKSPRIASDDPISTRSFQAVAEGVEYALARLTRGPSAAGPLKDALTRAFEGKVKAGSDWVRLRLTPRRGSDARAVVITASSVEHPNTDPDANWRGDSRAGHHVEISVELGGKKYVAYVAPLSAALRAAVSGFPGAFTIPLSRNIPARAALGLALFPVAAFPGAVPTASEFLLAEFGKSARAKGHGVNEGEGLVLQAAIEQYEGPNPPGLAEELDPTHPDYKKHDPKGVMAQEKLPIVLLDNFRATIHHQSSAVADLLDGHDAPTDVYMFFYNGRVYMDRAVAQAGIEQFNDEERALIAAHEMAHFHSSRSKEEDILSIAPLPDFSKFRFPPLPGEEKAETPAVAPVTAPPPPAAPVVSPSAAPAPAAPAAPAPGLWMPTADPFFVVIEDEDVARQRGPDQETYYRLSRPWVEYLQGVPAGELTDQIRRLARAGKRVVGVVSISSHLSDVRTAVSRDRTGLGYDIAVIEQGQRGPREELSQAVNKLHGNSSITVTKEEALAVALRAAAIVDPTNKSYPFIDALDLPGLIRFASFFNEPSKVRVNRWLRSDVDRARRAITAATKRQERYASGERSFDALSRRERLIAKVAADAAEPPIDAPTSVAALTKPEFESLRARFVHDGRLDRAAILAILDRRLEGNRLRGEIFGFNSPGANGPDSRETSDALDHIEAALGLSAPAAKPAPAPVAPAPVTPPAPAAKPAAPVVPSAPAVAVSAFDAALAKLTENSRLLIKGWNNDHNPDKPMDALQLTRFTQAFFDPATGGLRADEINKFVQSREVYKALFGDEVGPLLANIREALVIFTGFTPKSPVLPSAPVAPPVTAPESSSPAPSVASPAAPRVLPTLADRGASIEELRFHTRFREKILEIVRDLRGYAPTADVVIEDLVSVSPKDLRSRLENSDRQQRMQLGAIRAKLAGFLGIEWGAPKALLHGPSTSLQHFLGAKGAGEILKEKGVATVGDLVKLTYPELLARLSDARRKPDVATRMAHQVVGALHMVNLSLADGTRIPVPAPVVPRPAAATKRPPKPAAAVEPDVAVKPALEQASAIDLRSSIDQLAVTKELRARLKERWGEDLTIGTLIAKPYNEVVITLGRPQLAVTLQRALAAQNFEPRNWPAAIQLNDSHPVTLLDFNPHIAGYLDSKRIVTVGDLKTRSRSDLVRDSLPPTQIDQIVGGLRLAGGHELAPEPVEPAPAAGPAATATKATSGLDAVVLRALTERTGDFRFDYLSAFAQLALGNPEPALALLASTQRAPAQAEAETILAGALSPAVGPAAAASAIDEAGADAGRPITAEEFFEAAQAVETNPTLAERLIARANGSPVAQEHRPWIEALAELLAARTGTSATATPVATSAGTDLGAGEARLGEITAREFAEAVLSYRSDPSKADELAAAIEKTLNPISDADRTTYENFLRGLAPLLDINLNTADGKAKLDALPAPTAPVESMDAGAITRVVIANGMGDKKPAEELVAQLRDTLKPQISPDEAQRYQGLLKVLKGLAAGAVVTAVVVTAVLVIFALVPAPLSQGPLFAMAPPGGFSMKGVLAILTVAGVLGVATVASPGANGPRRITRDTLIEDLPIDASNKATLTGGTFHWTTVGGLVRMRPEAFIDWMVNNSSDPSRKAKATRLMHKIQRVLYGFGDIEWGPVSKIDDESTGLEGLFEDLRITNPLAAVGITTIGQAKAKTLSELEGIRGLGSDRAREIRGALHMAGHDLAGEAPAPSAATTPAAPVVPPAPTGASTPTAASRTYSRDEVKQIVAGNQKADHPGKSVHAMDLFEFMGTLQDYVDLTAFRAASESGKWAMLADISRIFHEVEMRRAVWMNTPPELRRQILSIDTLPFVPRLVVLLLTEGLRDGTDNNYALIHDITPAMLDQFRAKYFDPHRDEPLNRAAIRRDLAKAIPARFKDNAETNYLYRAIYGGQNANPDIARSNSLNPALDRLEETLMAMANRGTPAAPATPTAPAVPPAPGAPSTPPTAPGSIAPAATHPPYTLEEAKRIVAGDRKADHPGKSPHAMDLFEFMGTIRDYIELNAFRGGSDADKQAMLGDIARIFHEVELRHAVWTTVPAELRGRVLSLDTLPFVPRLVVLLLTEGIKNGTDDNYALVHDITPAMLDQFRAKYFDPHRDEPLNRAAIRRDLAKAVPARFKDTAETNYLYRAIYGGQNANPDIARSNSLNPALDRLEETLMAMANRGSAAAPAAPAAATAPVPAAPEVEIPGLPSADEFAALVEGNDRAAMERMIERLRDLLRDYPAAELERYGKWLAGLERAYPADAAVLQGRSERAPDGVSASAYFSSAQNVENARVVAADLRAIVQKPVLNADQKARVRGLIEFLGHQLPPAPQGSVVTLTTIFAFLIGAGIIGAMMFAGYAPTVGAKLGMPLLGGLGMLLIGGVSSGSDIADILAGNRKMDRRGQPAQRGKSIHATDLYEFYGTVSDYHALVDLRRSYRRAKGTDWASREQIDEANRIFREIEARKRSAEAGPTTIDDLRFVSRVIVLMLGRDHGVTIDKDYDLHGDVDEPMLIDQFAREYYNAADRRLDRKRIIRDLNRRVTAELKDKDPETGSADERESIRERNDNGVALYNTIHGGKTARSLDTAIDALESVINATLNERGAAATAAPSPAPVESVLDRIAADFTSVIGRNETEMMRAFADELTWYLQPVTAEQRIQYTQWLEALRRVYPPEVDIPVGDMPDSLTPVEFAKAAGDPIAARAFAEAIELELDKPTLTAEEEKAIRGMLYFINAQINPAASKPAADHGGAQLFSLAFPSAVVAALSLANPEKLERLRTAAIVVGGAVLLFGLAWTVPALLMKMIDRFAKARASRRPDTPVQIRNAQRRQVNAMLQALVARDDLPRQLAGGAALTDAFDPARVSAIVDKAIVNAPWSGRGDSASPATVTAPIGDVQINVFDGDVFMKDGADAAVAVNQRILADQLAARVRYKAATRSDSARDLILVDASVSEVDARVALFTQLRTVLPVAQAAAFAHGVTVLRFAGVRDPETVMRASRRLFGFTPQDAVMTNIYTLTAEGWDLSGFDPQRARDYQWRLFELLENLQMVSVTDLLMQGINAAAVTSQSA